MPSFASILCLCTGCAVLGMIIPAMAQTSIDSVETHSLSEEQPASPDVASTTVDSEHFQLIGPSLLNSSSDADALDTIANQINSMFDDHPESDEFLPDGMVVRGANGSLQLGGEI